MEDQPRAWRAPAKELAVAALWRGEVLYEAIGPRVAEGQGQGRWPAQDRKEDRGECDKQQRQRHEAYGERPQVDRQEPSPIAASARFRRAQVWAARRAVREYMPEAACIRARGVAKPGLAVCDYPGEDGMYHTSSLLSIGAGGKECANLHKERFCGKITLSLCKFTQAYVEAAGTLAYFLLKVSRSPSTRHLSYTLSTQ